MNPEQAVIDAISELVDHSLKQPIVDDYNVNRYAKCELCGNDWHGLPAYVYDGRSCPGECASDEAKAVWREMFPASMASLVDYDDISSPPLSRRRRGRGVTAFLYGSFFQSLLNREIDLNTDTIKVMLCTSAYIPNQDMHRYRLNVTNEVVGRGYTAGGATLTSATLSHSLDAEAATLSAADTVWPNSTITAHRAVVYDATPSSDATRPLISYLDFGADVISMGGNFTIAWDGGRILTLENQ